MKHVSLISFLMGLLPALAFWSAIQLPEFLIDSGSALVLGGVFAILATAMAFLGRTGVAVMSMSIAVVLFSVAFTLSIVGKDVLRSMAIAMFVIISTTGFAFLANDKWNVSFVWAFARCFAGGFAGSLSIHIILTNSIFAGLPTQIGGFLPTVFLLGILFFLPTGRQA